MAEEACDAVPRQAWHWEVSYFLCTERNDKLHVDWREFRSAAADRCGNLVTCVPGGDVRTPQSQGSAFGKDASQRVASIARN